MKPSMPLFGFLCVLCLGTCLSADEMDLLPIGDPDRATLIASAPAGSFFDCRTGEEISFEEMVERMGRYRILLLGEEHDRMDHHLLQSRIIRAVAARSGTPAVGMEFFQQRHDRSLKRYVSGDLDEEGLLDEIDWYGGGGLDFGYYRPVLEAAREEGAGVFGLNIPRRIVRSVSRGGLESLSEEERKIIGDAPPGTRPQHRYLLSRFFGDSAVQMPPVWLERMAEAQGVWDTVMARRALRILPEDAPVIVIVGGGHAAYGLGIARRVEEECGRMGIPPVQVGVFLPVTSPHLSAEPAPSGHPRGAMGMGGRRQQSALFVRSLADFVAVLPEPPWWERKPSLGAGWSERDGTIRVGFVLPDSAADEAGLRMGDVLLDWNGKEPDSLAGLRRELCGLRWGERLDLRIRRGEEEIRAAVLVIPGIDEEMKDLESRGITLLSGWDCSGDDSPTLPPGNPASQAYLIEGDGHPRRVAVRRSGRVEELHELDPAGRIARTLLRTPGEDGAVESRFE